MPDTLLVYAADREGDLWALIDAAARREVMGVAGPRAKRWGRCQILPVSGAGSPHLMGTAGALLHGSHAASASRPTRRTATAILAREEQPPVGEKAIKWRRLTNRTVDTLEDMAQRVDWHRKR